MAFPISVGAEETRGRDGEDNGQGKRAKEMDRKRTVRGGRGILFGPRLTSASADISVETVTGSLIAVAIVTP